VKGIFFFFLIFFFFFLFFFFLFKKGVCSIMDVESLFEDAHEIGFDDSVLESLLVAADEHGVDDPFALATSAPQQLNEEPPEQLHDEEKRDEVEFGCAALVLLVGTGELAAGRVATEAGCVMLSRDCAAGAAAVLGAYVLGDSTSFAALEPLLRRERRPVLLLALPTPSALAPLPAERAWCVARGFLGPIVLSSLAAAILPLVSRISLAAGRVPLAAVAGRVQATSAANGSLSLQCVLPGGICACRRGNSGPVVLAPLSEYQFSSTLVVRATAASGVRGGGDWLSFAPGDEIHVLSTSLGKKRWFGFANGTTGFFAMRGTDAAAAPPPVPMAVPAVLQPQQQQPGSPFVARRRLARQQAVEHALTPVSVMAAPVTGEEEEDFVLFCDAPDRLNLLVRMMTASEGGLERTLKRKARGRKLKKPVLQSWESTEAVSWLLANGGVAVAASALSPPPPASKADALRIMQGLLDENFIYNAVDPQTTRFEDDGDLWRFWCDGPAPPLNVRQLLPRRAVSTTRHAGAVRRRKKEKKKRILVQFRLLVDCFVMHWLCSDLLLDLEVLVLERLNWIIIDCASFVVGRILRQQLASCSASISTCLPTTTSALHFGSIHTTCSLCIPASATRDWSLVDGKVCKQKKKEEEEEEEGTIFAQAKVGGFFTDSQYIVGGSVVSLFQIHSGLLRQNSTTHPLGGPAPPIEVCVLACS
jgi:hypothetical protein